MKFSLVVPLAPDRNAPIIESIKEMDYPKSEFHVVVVKGLNPSENRNKGAAKSNGEIIAFLDDDALVKKNYLQKAEEFFNKHPEIDIVGGPQLSPEDDGRFAKISGYGLMSKFGAWSVAHRYSLRDENLDADESMLTSANMLCRKSVMNKIKWDTKFFPGEDPKFIEDAKKAGLKIAYSPDIIVYHKRRPTVRLFMKQMFNYGKTRPFKESFFQTMKMPFFLVPSAFAAYLFLLLLLIGTNFALTGNVFSSNILLINNVPLFSKIYVIPLAVYIVLAFLFAVNDSVKNKHFNAVFFLPFIYFLIHISYGYGMIWGYVKKNFRDSSVG